MRNRDKYLLGTALGLMALGLGLVAAKAAPKLKARMAGHCRGMIASFVKAADNERKSEPVPR